jgi:hypothetical protein
MSLMPGIRSMSKNRESFGFGLRNFPKTGICNCGCGSRCNPKRRFAPGHPEKPIRVRRFNTDASYSAFVPTREAQANRDHFSFTRNTRKTRWRKTKNKGVRK